MPSTPDNEIIRRDAREILAALPLPEIAGKTILLTGASGIVGTYFLATLRELADGPNAPKRVYAVMRREPPAHVRKFLEHPSMEVVRGDLTDLKFCSGLSPASLIIHAGGYGQPGKFMENPLATIKLNTAATFELLGKLEAGGRFLFVSTSELYSGLPQPPYREDQIGTTNTDHVRSCYIEGKRCGEAICNAARKQGIGASSARLALAYGPGTQTDDQRVINTIIRRALTEKAIRLMDRGEAKRTYCYVADAVRILWLILLKGNEAIYNVGGESTTTIRGLADLVGELTGTGVTVPEDAKPLAGAPDDVRLDMSRFAKEFGPIKFLDLREGVRRTIEWQKGLYSSVASS